MQYLLNLEEFKENCTIKKCQRHTMITNNCVKDYKQEKCFTKYVEKQKSLIQESKEAIEQSNLDWQKRSILKDLGYDTSKPIEVDQEYETFKKDVWETYAGFYDQNVSNRKDWKSICMFWKCLTKVEKDLVFFADKNNFWLNKNIDIAHIIGKGEQPPLKNDINNVVLIGRLWHSRIDTYIDPITEKQITQEQRLDWFKRIKGE